VAATATDHSVLPLLLQILGLTIGWVIVHWLSKARDIDKERRSLISNTAESQIVTVNALLLVSRAYHINGSRDQELELKIKMGLQDLAESVSALHRIVQEPSSIRSALNAIKNLRRAITGEHFEDEHTGPLTERDIIIEGIALEALNAKRALLILRHAQYRQHQRAK
jgi:hypothetical protein